MSEDANDVTTFILVDKYRHFVYQHQLSSDNSVHIYQTTRCHVPKDAYSNEIIFDGSRLRTDVANVRGKSVQLSIVNANVQLSIVNAKKGTHQKYEYICEQGLVVYKNSTRVCIITSHRYVLWRQVRDSDVERGISRNPECCRRS